VEFSPLGGIPGVPTALAAVIILFAAQMLLGLKHLWIPQFLSHRGISGESLKRAAAKIRPLGDWLDRWLHGRLPWLTSEPFVQIAAAACIIFALTVPPLELFPFASSAPMATIAMFGLALLVQDGVLMIVGSVLAVTALVVGFGFFAL
jgi:hypothetical protein